MAAPTAETPTAADFLNQAIARLDALCGKTMTPVEHELWRATANLAAAVNAGLAESAAHRSGPDTADGAAA